MKKKIQVQSVSKISQYKKKTKKRTAYKTLLKIKMYNKNN